MAALHIALGGLPDKMRVEVDRDIGVSAKTVGELRKVKAWPENLAITTPQERYPESAVRVNKANVATRFSPAGTERYLAHLLVRPEIHGLSWRERDQQPLANQRAQTVAHTPEKSRPLALKLKRIYAPRVISDHIMVQEDFERLHKFLLETEGLPEVSDDMRELVEEEWPELVHKLPPKMPATG